MKSQAGRWDPNSQTWVQGDVTSNCIDRRDPNSPIGDEPMPNGGIINMGAYGGTSEASISIGTLPPLPPPPPIAHWKLDEAEGTIAHDSGCYDFDGILIGDPLWQPTGGKVDGALQLDGIDDYVSTPFLVNPFYDIFSVFAWIKGGGPGQVIISQADGADWLLADPTDGALRTDLRTPDMSTPRSNIPAGPPLICSTVVTDGDWHRIGFVWDGSFRSLYVDGAEVARDAAPLSRLEGAVGGLYLGAGSTLTTDTFFSGLIDDVRIYNRAVTP